MVHSSLNELVIGMKSLCMPQIGVVHKSRNRRWGDLSKYYSIAWGEGRAGQMITVLVLHRGGPANDYGVPGFWRESTRNFFSANLGYVKMITSLNIVIMTVLHRGVCLDD